MSAWAHTDRATSIPDEAVEHPHKPQGPANRGVAAQAAPVEEQVRTDFLAGYNGREHDEDRGAGIVGGLEEDDLGKNARG